MRHVELNPRRRGERALERSFGELTDRLQVHQQKITRHSSRIRRHRIEALKRKLAGAHRILGRLHERLAHYGKWSTSTEASRMRKRAAAEPPWEPTTTREDLEDMGKLERRGT
jgi:hypothetical protein